MNGDDQSVPTTTPTLDLQALLATMPDFSMLPSLSNMPKDSTSTTDIPTSPSILFPPIPNDQLAALSLGLFPLPGFPMFPLLPMTPLSSTVPPHSTIESLGLMTSSNLRQSAYTMAPPSVDSRPRAFSSAAALQRPKQAATPERRRKRSRKAQGEVHESSVLRMLVDEEDDTPIKIHQPATRDLDEKLRMDAAKASVLNESSPPLAKRASPERAANLAEAQSPSRIALRRIIRDEDLPDSIGPDSPFRHHPKYQRKQHDSELEVIDGMEALTAFCVVSGYVPESSEPGASPKRDSTSYTGTVSPKKSFNEMMEHAICRELVTAE
uniref:BHLH domain-containing protein n=1 Tax=Angiostrongylus cantonensis TaxID=6313 RepID=A0A0K0CSS8_ANGCA